MKTLFIHAGFTKTGSSFLQVFFAQNAPVLRETFRLHYALPDGSASEQALSGEISSGNGSQIVHDLKAGIPVSTILDAYLDPSCEHSLISTEAWWRVSKEHNIALKEEAVRRGYQVRCIAFRRDPFELAISSYLQLVKRAAMADSFEDYTARYTDRHRQHEQHLRSVFDVTVLNYEDCKHNLAAALISEMGFDPAKLPPQEAGIVNRSLSREEYLFLRDLNARHKDKALSKLLSDQLVMNYPFSGTPFRYSRETFTNICNALQLDPEEEAARRGFQPGDTPLDPAATIETALRLQGHLCDLLLEARTPKRRTKAERAARRRARTKKSRLQRILTHVKRPFGKQED